MTREQGSQVIQQKFYQEKKKFVEDIRGYISNIEKEWESIIAEVSGGKMEVELFAIGMIPLKPHINGVLITQNTKKLKGKTDFECDDFRRKIGSRLDAFREVIEYEKENVFAEDEEEERNLKRCELYDQHKMKFPYIRRHGDIKNPFDFSLILSKVKELIGSDRAVFVSNWVEFGPFCVFFVTKLNEEAYANYLEEANTSEEDFSYQFFLDTLINNFFEKWLEFVYYGLLLSTIECVSDSQAIIAASANDMFEARGIPTEHIFTKIANYKYEGAPCKGKIVFSDRTDPMVRFENPISVDENNAKKIRKILEMSNESTCLVASKSGQEIIGLGDSENYKKSYLIEFLDTNMWSFSYDGKQIVKYINGQYRIPEKFFDKDLFLQKCEDRFRGSYHKSILSIVEAASHQKHGTMVIITPNAEKESEVIVKEGKGTGIREVDLTKAGREMILGLCSIDGALMIDPYGKCFGIGLILSSPNSGIGNPERGARYNSAVNYSNNNERSVVVVISEDGMIDIL